MMLDVDHFKPVNDRWGHPAGDKVLAQIAHVIREECRDSDIPIRYGGEEFAVLLPGADHRERAAGGGAHPPCGRGQRVRAARRQRGRADDLGRGQLRQRRRTAEQDLKPRGDRLVAEADVQLYRAKSKGRNRVCGARPEGCDMWLTVEGIEQAYGENQVLSDLSFRIPAGAIGCLLGPSGCGKTTALRCIAGFESVRAGRILVNGEVLSKPGFVVPPEKRGFGMVFQQYALFPHLDVAANVGFGLKEHARSRRRRGVWRRCWRSSASATSGGLYPDELSGGQQQRVALARALAPRPGLLLMDEPFSSLDTGLRVRLGSEIRDILKQQGITALLVTHDQGEAFAVADEIGVMRDRAAGAVGHRLQPLSSSRRAALSRSSWARAASCPARRTRTAPCRSSSAGSSRPNRSRPARTRAVEVLLRPDDIVHDDDSTLTATVLRKAFRGAAILYTLGLPSGRRVLALVPSHHDHSIGERIGIRLEADHVVVFR
jgi:iron(III) transport system ATP-binding protein